MNASFVAVALLVIGVWGCKGTPARPAGPASLVTTEPRPGKVDHVDRVVEMENGAYFDWAGFKPGTWVRTWKLDVQQGSRQETASTARLITRSESRVVVQYGDSPISRAAYGRRIFVPSEGRAAGDRTEVRKGAEVLEIRGWQIPCEWVEYALDVQGATCAIRSWRSPEIPGAVVRTEVVTTRAGQVERTTSTKVIDWHLEE